MSVNAISLDTVHTHTHTNWNNLTNVIIQKQFGIYPKCLFVRTQELFDSLTHTHWIYLTNVLDKKIKLNLICKKIAEKLE